MRTALILTLVFGIPSGKVQASQEKIKEDFGKENPKWKFVAGTWVRRESGERKVLAQTKKTQPWAVALLEDKKFADLDISVKFHPISGDEDASGGIIFRAKDGKNYYVVRANALEDNFRLYTIIDGSRSQIASAQVKAPKLGEWHTIRVVAKGEQIQAYLDDKLLLEHKDKTYTEGYVGLWTKADSVTEFDALLIVGTPSKETAKLEIQEGGQMSDDFEKENPKWRFHLGHWERRKSGDAWVLAKTGEYVTYNVALLEERRFADVDVSIRFKPISGKADASGGIVFRARDAQNYFVVRANALEDNFRLYTTIDGKRKQIASTKVKEPAFGQWHKLRLVAKGDHIQAYLNDELLIDHHDGTFKDGWVGLWTKEDSVTEFDDLSVKGTGSP